MSLIAVVPDHHCKLAVFYASEAHYLVDAKFSFVTFELAFSVDTACDSVSLILDGVMPSANERQRLATSWNFRELLDISDCTVRPDQSGIWDFRETLFERLITNQGYEGPDDWKEIRVNRTNRQIVYVGQVASVPAFSTKRTRADGHLTQLVLDGAQIPANGLQVLRLGLFLARHVVGGSGFRSRVSSQFARRPRSAFITRFFSYSEQEDEVHLKNLGVYDWLSDSSLALTLKPFVDLAGRHAEYSEEPTSDLWVVGYGRNSASVRSPQGRLDENSQHRPTGLGLFTQKTERLDSALWETHFVPKIHSPQHQKQASISPTSEPVFDAISWTVEVPGVTIRGLGRWLSNYYMVPAAFVLAVVAYLSRDSSSFALVVLVAFALLIAVLYWCRQKVPSVRRFFEQESRY